MRLLVLLIHVALSLFCITGSLPVIAAESEKVLRVGIIGCDTSHVSVFSKLINSADSEIQGLKIVGAYPGGSKDITASYALIPQYTKELQERGIRNSAAGSVPATANGVRLLR